jgi:hypothetical protein
VPGPVIVSVLCLNPSGTRATVEAIYELASLEQERDEVDVPLVSSIENNSVLLGRLEIDGKVRASANLKASVELQKGILPLA